MQSPHQGCCQQLWVGFWEGSSALCCSFPSLYRNLLSLKYTLCLLPFKKSSSIMLIYSFKQKFIPDGVTHSSAPSPRWHHTSEKLPVPCCLSSSLFTRVAPDSRLAKLAALGFQLPAPVRESHWKLLWAWIKLAHENILKSSSLAKCQQLGDGHQRELDVTPQRIQSVS